MDTAGKEPRVRKSFDFTQLRYIVSLGNTKPAIRKANLERLRRASKGSALPKDADAILQATGGRCASGTRNQLAEDRGDGRPQGRRAAG